MPPKTRFHLLSFEGPDPYSQAGGIASRVSGLAAGLAGLGFETHLWFVGDPDLPGNERRGSLELHRWSQWISRHHPGGVYDGEEGKRSDYASSLPPHLAATLVPGLEHEDPAVILAEEWQTADAVLHLDWLLHAAGLRHRVEIFWNANNTFGFDRIDWPRLSAAARITTVSRYMKHRMREFGVDPIVIPNGLGDESFTPPNRGAIRALRERFGSRPLLAKMARWDPDKRWLLTIDILAELKREGLRPLLVARGGVEPHGQEVLAAARARGLRVVARSLEGVGAGGLLRALESVNGADVVNLTSPVDAEARRTLFRGASSVLANSGHEPFGLVGLETMAAGGLACTGLSGEDYAIPGRNALVMQTDDPREFVGQFRRLRALPAAETSLRRAGRQTARRFAWSEVIERDLLPRIEHERHFPRSGNAPGVASQN